MLFVTFSAICDFLTGDEMLAYIGSHLGLKDIVLASVSASQLCTIL